MRLNTIQNTEIHNQDSEFLRLANACLEARRVTEEAREAQLEAEKKLLELPVVQEKLKESGTSNYLDGFMKITTKLNQKWDQKLLADIIQNNDWPVMAFDIEYKPNAARLKVLKEQFPGSYRKLQDAMTVTPAKPYFTFGEV